jgi:transposase
VASTKASAAVDVKGHGAPRCPGCQQRDATIAKLQHRNARLRQRLKNLQRQHQQEQERLGRNSTNSSVPPSCNPLDAPKPQTRKQRSGRNRGGQPGHPDTSPGFIPVEDLTEPPIDCIPDTCRHCHAPLSGRDDMPSIHQVIDLPPITPEVREYRRHILTCDGCGQSSRGQLPDGVPAGGYGVRLQAFIALCTGCYHLSKRQIEELLNISFDIPISLGSICNVERRVSAALAEPVATAKEHLQQVDHAHADETSWPQQPDNGWLWVGVTAYLAVFSIRAKRDLDSAKDLLGSGFAGVLVCDRYAAYNWVGRRQLCWAHLRRDWQAMIDRGGASRRIGRQLLQLTDKMFHRWHRVRDGTLPRLVFKIGIDMITLRNEVGAWLRRGARCAHPRTAGTCANILEQESALWTFVDVEGIEPTNNAAERVLRQAVLWRKKSFGTRSADGSRFVERMLTAVATCRLQDRNVLDYLTAACVAAVNDRPAPSLLPPDSRP